MPNTPSEEVSTSTVRGTISLESKESDGREGRGRESDDSVRIKLGLRDHLGLFVALLETVAIPLLVMMAVLTIIVLLAFK